MNKKIIACMLIVNQISLIPLLAGTETCKTCNGYENWEWSDDQSSWPNGEWPSYSERASDTYGICNYPGSYVYTRTMGSCIDGSPTQSCTTSSYATRMEKVVHSVQVSAAEIAACDQAYENDLATLSALEGACVIAGGADAVLGCALFVVTGPGYAACVAAVASGAAACCHAAYMADKATLEHERSDCKWDCVDEPYEYTNYVNGCYE